jgi:hypothetical protein
VFLRHVPGSGRYPAGSHGVAAAGSPRQVVHDASIARSLPSVRKQRHFHCMHRGTVEGRSPRPTGARRCAAGPSGERTPHVFGSAAVPHRIREAREWPPRLPSLLWPFVAPRTCRPGRRPFPRRPPVQNPVPPGVPFPDARNSCGFESPEGKWRNTSGRAVAAGYREAPREHPVASAAHSAPGPGA